MYIQCFVVEVFVSAHVSLVHAGMCLDYDLFPDLRGSTFLASSTSSSLCRFVFYSGVLHEHEGTSMFAKDTYQADSCVLSCTWMRGGIVLICTLDTVVPL